ncbi:MAG: LTA synthase family protein [Prevotellaceae bacterium]|jgi:phosphoglycerol transferase MdoB-like AlkP superfamily enzyme|nr:LTA synthase family protein [Prevotellaceae bacterium]
MKKETKSIKFYLATFYKLTGLTVSVGLITRIILLFNPQTEVAFSFTNWVAVFLAGAANDLFFALIICVFMWLLMIFLSEEKYKKPWGLIIFGLISAALVYVCIFNTVFDEYGNVLPPIIKSLLGYKFISFGLRLFAPQIRVKWRQIVYNIIFFIFVTGILLNAVSEYFFWSEFGVRYNFIAVDYLIYTNEVVGNIMESYPIIPLFCGLFAVSGLVTYFFLGKTPKDRLYKLPPLRQKALFSAVYLPLLVIAYFGLNFTTRYQNTNNQFVNELQANGAFKFYTAFVNNELDYYSFFTTIPEKEAFTILYHQYGSTENNLQQIRDTLPDIHKNIVLITVESLSADFMERFGNKSNITPYLDSLYKESMTFDNMFATGNRTVRGLEAVTLSLPPSPGHSLIKRSNNSNFYSTASILREKGYSIQYFYGGDSYFDNMQSFFLGNGYDIIDRKKFTEKEISFQNIWGVCDEDMFDKAIAVFNGNADTDKPFFGHIMTVSNHRPFTYPDKIDISPLSKTRSGGVKYTDYAIGKFMENAQKQKWFSNTVFVIMADHCASSAGKTQIPLDKYHIPALIYAPNFITPQHIEVLTSQIDVMPTLFGLLHFSYASHFYGKNVLDSNYVSRALIATYQNLGYLRDSVFTVLSPVKRVEQYKVKTAADKYEMTLMPVIDSLCLKQGVANYQTSYILIKNRRYNLNE